MASERGALAALVKDAYYHARDHGGTMHTAADDAADAILAAGWIPGDQPCPVHDWQEARAERDALAATVQRVRALSERWDRAAAADIGLDFQGPVRIGPIARALRAALGGEANDGDD